MALKVEPKDVAIAAVSGFILGFAILLIRVASKKIEEK